MITTLNPEQAQQALLLNWTATELAKQRGLSIRIPTALIGGTGCGKTDAVKAFGGRLRELSGSAGFWNIRMSHILPEDLGGYAAKCEATKKLTYNMMDALPFDSDEVGVLFLDEFDRASEGNQNAALPLVYGDNFHGHRISPNAYVVLALNGEADDYTTPLSKAAITRVCTIFVARNDGGESYIRWAKAAGIPENVIEFHRDHGNLIEQKTDFESLAICTSRTLDMAGMVSMAKRRLGDRIEDTVYEACVYGLIGLEAGSKYLIAERISGELDIDGIIARPDKVDIPPRHLLQHVLGVLVNRCEADRTIWDAVHGFVRRIESGEWREHFYSCMLDRIPDVALRYKEYSGRVR